MKPIDNANLLGLNKNFDHTSFLPKLTYTYDASEKTIVIEDESTLPAGHTLKHVNIMIIDDYGNIVYAAITASGTAVQDLLDATAAALALKNSTAATTATKLAARTAAQDAFTADNTNVVKAEALGVAKAEYDAALAISEDASDAYDTAVAASDAAVADADHTTGELDISGLNASKGINVTATMVTDHGWTATGSAYKIVAAGELENWNKGESAGSNNPE